MLRLGQALVVTSKGRIRTNTPYARPICNGYSYGRTAAAQPYANVPEVVARQAPENAAFATGGRSAWRRVAAAPHAIPRAKRAVRKKPGAESHFCRAMISIRKIPRRGPRGVAKRRSACMNAGLRSSESCAQRAMSAMREGSRA